MRKFSRRIDLMVVANEPLEPGIAFQILTLVPGSPLGNSWWSIHWCIYTMYEILFVSQLLQTWKQCKTLRLYPTIKTWYLYWKSMFFRHTGTIVHLQGY